MEAVVQTPTVHGQQDSNQARESTNTMQIRISPPPMTPTVTSITASRHEGVQYVTGDRPNAPLTPSVQNEEYNMQKLASIHEDESVHDSYSNHNAFPSYAQSA